MPFATFTFTFAFRLFTGGGAELVEMRGALR